MREVLQKRTHKYGRKLLCYQTHLRTKTPNFLQILRSENESMCDEMEWVPYLRYIQNSWWKHQVQTETGAQCAPKSLQESRTSRLHWKKRSQKFYKLIVEDLTSIYKISLPNFKCAHKTYYFSTTHKVLIYYLWLFYGFSSLQKEKLCNENTANYLGFYSVQLLSDRRSKF